MTPAELLGRTEIFSSLPPQHIQQISARLVRHEFSKGTVIVRQGQPGDSMFIIESGQVGVYVRDVLFGLDVEVAQLGTGDCVGEMALITADPRNATCTALERTVAYQLDRPVFEAVVTQATPVLLSLTKVLAERLTAVNAKRGVPFITLSGYEPDPKLTAMVPEQLVRAQSVVPVAMEDGAVTVAAVDPSNSAAIEEVERYMRGVRVRPVAVTREDFDQFVERLGYKNEEIRPSMVGRPSRLDIQFLSDTEESDRGSTMSGQEVLQLVNQIIAMGIDTGASDIHIEPSRTGTRVRFRIHGALEEKLPTIPANSHKTLISRFKVLAKLDITDARKSQEGRISLDVSGRAVDLRLSLIPTKLGQKAVMRILDSGTSLMGLEKLVLAEKVRQAVRKMFYAPHGVVLVTGPTGSGKTTTMYSALLERRNPEINIVTVEDPVEFHLDGLSQVEIGSVPGIDFASMLRSFLRQDPDVILVGETRDAETAKLALQAGLTGRLVFTSFHANDCISSVVRLMEMGMEPFALANALVGVIHQRLIRRLCPHCRQPFEYYPQIIENLRASGVIGNDVPTLYRTKGCERCQGQGFLGRVSALEVLVVNDAVSSAIGRQASPDELRAAGAKGAFVPLSRYMGFLLQHGITVPGEVLGALPRREQG